MNASLCPLHVSACLQTASPCSAHRHRNEPSPKKGQTALFDSNLLFPVVWVTLQAEETVRDLSAPSSDNIFIFSTMVASAHGNMLASRRPTERLSGGASPAAAAGSHLNHWWTQIHGPGRSSVGIHWNVRIIIEHLKDHETEVGTRRSILTFCVDAESANVWRCCGVCLWFWSLLIQSSLQCTYSLFITLKVQDRCYSFTWRMLRHLSGPTTTALTRVETVFPCICWFRRSIHI